MKPTTATAVLAGFLMIGPLEAWSQSRDMPAQAELSEQERQYFDARLRDARTEQERATILAERDNLLQRRTPQGDLRQIPPSPRELSNDPIMSDVPTPRSNEWPSGTLPGGALAPTGSGTGPSPITGTGGR